MSVHSSVSVHVPSELIIIDWAHSPIYESIYHPPLRVDFLNSEQLIYNSKTEKQQAGFENFLSITSIARNFNLPGLKKKYFSYKMKNIFFRFKLKKLKDPYSFFGSDVITLLEESLTRMRVVSQR